MNIREKYRIRMYNNDPSIIHLERKFKHSGLGCKTSANLTRSQAQAIADGNVEWMYEFGAAASLCSFVYITVNDEDWGLYLAVEGVEDSFLEQSQVPEGNGC